MSNYPLPPAFIERIKADPFLDSQLLDALDSTVPISIRFNRHKAPNMILDKPISWCPLAKYLDERPSFTLDPLFHAGKYYPQEAGSMMLDQVLRQLELPDEPVVLDLCAAPGGKSTLIADFLDEKGLLVANEVIQSRSQILKENLTKWGSTNTIVTNNDPADFKRLPHFFDLIVVDAPCSGEGMFRKDHLARNEWSPEHVDFCASRQKRILSDVWDSLAPSGFLIYSTCTFNTKENESIVAWLKENNAIDLVQLNYSPYKTGRDQIGAYALPSEQQTEGFYIVALQKSNSGKRIKRPKLKKVALSRTKDSSPFMSYFNDPAFEIWNWNDRHFALPSQHIETFKIIQEQLKIVKFGTEVGALFKGKLLPDQALAFCPHLLIYKERIELTLDQALHYLKGETFDLPATKGIYLVCYQNLPLGWIKHLGNRFNNLYPSHWRIRMRLD